MGLFKVTRNKRFNYSKNLKNVRRKEKKKSRNEKKLTLVTNEAKLIDQHWDHKRTMKANMKDLGLSMDANEAVKIGKTRYVNFHFRPIRLL